MKRYAPFRSGLASVGRRLGVFALPVILLAIGLHWIGAIDPQVMAVSVIVGTGLGLVAIAISLAAFRSLWTRGGVGYASASFGIVFGLVAVAPVFVYGMLAVRSPALTEASTDRVDPPQFDIAPAGEAEILLPNLPVWLSGIDTKSAGSAAKDLQVTHYPDIVSRRYRIPPARLHMAALNAAERRGWSVRAELPPDLLDAATRLQLEAKTPVLGLVSDIAIRVRPDPVGSLVDIRAVSRVALPDWTGNAGRIRLIFAGIDEVLLETYGDIGQLAVLDEDFAEDRDITGGATAVEDLSPTIPVPAFKPYFESSEDPLPEDPFDTEEALSG